MFKNQLSAPFKAQLAMILLLIFHFIRQLLTYYEQRDQFIILMMSNFLIQIALEVFFISVCQRALQFVFILINVILFQMESIKYGFDNVDTNYSFIIIIYIQYNFESQENRKAFWQVIQKLLPLILFLSFSYSKDDSEKQRSIDYYCKILNEKLNMAIVIFLLSSMKGYNIQEQKLNILSAVDEKVISKPYQNQKQEECIKQDIKSSSFQDLSEINTDRKQTFQKQQLLQQIDENLLLDNLSEGVIIIKFEKSEESQIYKPRVDYQNQISKTMFQKSNEDLLPFFERIPSEVLSDEFQRDLQIGELSLVSPMLYTVYKCLLDIIKTEKLGLINGKIKALIIETNFEIDDKEKRVEMLITIGGKDLLLVIARNVVNRKINYSKSKMLAWIYHEFRCPLNQIIYVLQNIMKDNSIQQSLIQPLKTVIENSYYLLNLSDNLIDLELIKNQTFRLNYQTIDIVWINIQINFNYFFITYICSFLLLF